MLLPDQDRHRWHREEIDEAVALLDAIPSARPMSAQAASYLLQARIAAEHATATSASATRWDRIVGHYDALLEVMPSSAAELARAVALSESAGPAAGLRALEQIADVGSHRPSAVRAELLRLLERAEEARESYHLALERCGNAAETAHLRTRLLSLDGRVG